MARAREWDPKLPSALTQAAHSSSSHNSQLQAGQSTQVIHHEHHRGSCRMGGRMRLGSRGFEGAQRVLGGSPGVRDRWEALDGSVMCFSIVSTALSAGSTWRGHEAGEEQSEEVWE